MAKASDTSWKRRMICQPSAPTGVLGLRKSPDTIPGWGVSGAQVFGLHSSELLAAGRIPACLVASVGKGMDEDTRQRQQREEGPGCARL